MRHSVNPSLAVVLLSAVVLAAPLPTRADDKVPTYPEHQDLTYYLDPTGGRIPIRTAEQWQIRKHHVVANLQRVMGQVPGDDKRVPLQMRQVEEVRVGKLIRRKITYGTEPSTRVGAYLFLPESDGKKLPAVLVLQQTTKAGKEEPAGLKGRESMHIALHLAQRGYITLAPDYPSFGEYAYDFSPKHGYVSGSMKAIWDNIRAVDLLQSLPEVDPERIGCIGHSLGGHNTMFTAAFEPRLKVLVSSCGFCPFHKDDVPSWTGPRYMPRIASVYKNDADLIPFDFPEIIGTFAPRPFLACAAVHDDDFDVSGVREGMAAAKTVYAVYGIPGHLAAYYPDSPHDFPEDARHVAYAFLDQHLKPETAELKVLSPGQGVLMLDAVFKQQAYQALDRRKVEYEKLKTPEQLAAYQQRQRAFFLRQLGGFPERTPLNAQVVGTLPRDGYRVEKVLFESQPNHHVTGLLYLPDGKPPYPGVLIPCGHSVNGKAAEAYQRIGILLAKSGLAGFCYDPIGQGERSQILDAMGKAIYSTTSEHTLMGIGSILLGTNTARYRIWDGMRAVDYLQSRPEIDPKRIGCTGNSGGGTLTSYLMALDDRIACAAPSCYLTTFRRLLATVGPQDAEQNIYGQIAHGLDEADYVLMRAPRPTLICAGTRDATFDITGTWDLFREAKRFYGRLGYPERVDLVEADEPHGFTRPLRVGATRWLRRWLLGLDDAIDEPPFSILSDREVQCTPEGQVLRLPGERSVFDLNREREAKLAPNRRDLWAKAPKEEVLQAVRDAAGVRRLAKLPEPKLDKVGDLLRQGYRIEKLVLTPEPGIRLPALAFVPATADRDAYLYLHGQGKHMDARAGGPIEALVRKGHLVLVVDLRGIGETESHRGRDWARGLFGPNAQESFQAYLLGKSLVGLRAEDALVCGRFLARYEENGAPRNVHVIATGTAAIPALHAAALEPEMFASLALREVLASWARVVATPVPKDQLSNTVHGVLEVYDLPDLLRGLGKKAVIEGP